MSELSPDDLSRLRQSWPEPLLIDLIGDCYDGAPADRLTPARLHVRFLRELLDGKIRPAAALRVELIGCCAARGITPDAIEAADKAAFLELVRIFRTRFRNSPRLCLHALQQLHTAAARLPKSDRSTALRPMARRAFAPMSSAPMSSTPMSSAA